MPREPYSPRAFVGKILSLTSGFFFELGFILFVILLVLGITSVVTFVMSLVG